MDSGGDGDLRPARLSCHTPLMRYFLLGLSLAGAATLSGACGGKAIIDPAGQGGSSASSTSSTSTGPSVTVGTCTCTNDAQCPTPTDGCFDLTCNGCSCVEAPLPPGAPCLGGVCDGASSCVECVTDADCGGGVCDDGACTNGGVEEVCDEVCDAFAGCFGPDPECFDGCDLALADCSPDALQEVAACVSFLEPGCDVDGASQCILNVPCAED